MRIAEIIHIIYIIVAFIIGLIPSILSFIKAAKAKKQAKTAVEKEIAQKDMLEQANNFIVAAEEFYKNLDTVLKSNGQSAGAYKKESVMNKLQAYAMDKGYVFDLQYWSTKIDEIVKLTKQVNSK